MQREEAKRGKAVEVVEGWWWGSGVSVVMCNQTHGTCNSTAAVVCQTDLLWAPALSPFLPFSGCLSTFSILSPSSLLFFIHLISRFYLIHPRFLRFLYFYLCFAWLPISSFTLCPLASSLSTFTSLLTTLTNQSQQIKQNPSINSSWVHLISQIAAERRAWGKEVFFAGKHYLMASNQLLRVCHCLIVRKWVCFFSAFSVRHLSLCLSSKLVFIRRIKRLFPKHNPL